MTKYILHCILIPSLTILSLDCVKDSDPEKIKEAIEKKEEIRFFSRQNPGKWKNESVNHVPEYKIRKDKKFKYIDVIVPFSGTVNPIHYVEVIVLLDHNRKELQKVTFDRGNREAKATFKLPLDYKSFMYVVAKCNLHDMWENRVFW